MEIPVKVHNGLKAACRTYRPHVVAALHRGQQKISPRLMTGAGSAGSFCPSTSLRTVSAVEPKLLGTYIQIPTKAADLSDKSALLIRQTRANSSCTSSILVYCRAWLPTTSRPSPPKIRRLKSAKSPSVFGL